MWRSPRWMQLGGGATAHQYVPRSSDFPIVMFPSRSFWCRQQSVSLADIGTKPFAQMVERLKGSRSYYKYPCMTAPQVGWNVQVFTLYDGSVWINPEVQKCYTDPSCWTWEVCASHAFMVHYIQRPYRIVAAGYDLNGAWRTEEMCGMRGRLFQHCMDFMSGELFHRRIPDASHVVTMDGFHTMSEWDDDYPSLEARSTNLYTIFIPPTTFLPEYLDDANLLDRQYKDKIYPGHEAYEELLQMEHQQGADLERFKEKLRQQQRRQDEECRQ